MNIGYARLSTLDQNLNLQIGDVSANPIFFSMSN